MSVPPLESPSILTIVYRQGAIKRMKVEQDAHTITYEAFVAELDEGDSFTTSLIDVLVKVCPGSHPVSHGQVLRGSNVRN